MNSSPKEKEYEELLLDVDISKAVCYICTKMIRDDDKVRECKECSKFVHPKCLCVKLNCDETDLPSIIRCDKCHMNKDCNINKHQLKEGSISIIHLPNETSTSGFNGPVKERKCTDIFLLYFNISAAIAFAMLMIFCLAGGNPLIYTYGTDSCGNICGFDNWNGNMMPQCNLEDFTQKRLVQFQDSILNPNDLSLSKRECVSACDHNMVQVMHYCMKLGNWTTLQDKQTEALDKLNFRPKDKILIMEQFGARTYQISNDNEPWSLTPQNYKIRGNTWGDSIQGIFDASGDLWFTKEKILQVFALCLGVSYIFILIVSFATKFFIWATIVLLYLLLFTVTCYLGTVCIAEYQCTPGVDCHYQDRFSLTVLTLTLMAMTIIALLKLNPCSSKNASVKKRINMLAALYNEAGNVIGAIPSLMFLPILTIIFVGFSLYTWFQRTLIIESIAEVDINDEVYISGNQMVARIFSILAGLWGVQFIMNCQDMVVAGAVSQWYFARNKSMVKWPVIKSIYRLVRYHLGSVLLGCLVLYPLAFIFYLIKSIVKFHRNTKEDLKKVVYLLFMTGLQFLGTDLFHIGSQMTSNQTYVQTAIYGRGFFRSFARNLKVQCKYLRYSVSVSVFGVIFVNVGKLMIVGSICALTMYGLGLGSSNTNSETLRVRFILGMGYFISHTCCSIFQGITDAVYICFLEDCENNDGSKSYFMNKSLQEFIEEDKESVSPKYGTNQRKPFFKIVVTRQYQQLNNKTSDEKEKLQKY